MLGTATLVATGVLGFYHAPIWAIIPIAIVNNFIGMHSPPERLDRLRDMGVSYWSFFLSNLPLIAIFTIAIYGTGYGVGLFFD